MELPFEKTQCRFWQQKLFAPVTKEETQEYRLPEGMPDIGRMLTAWGQIMLRSKQWQGGEIELSGGVKVWVLYAPEDGTEPRVTEGWLPFQLKWNPEPVEREGPVRMMPLLRFVDSRSTSARKMMVRAGVGVLAQGFYPAEAEIHTPEDVPEDERKTEDEEPPVYEEQPTAPPAETEPPAGSTNSSGQVYVPGFGYVDDSGENSGTEDDDMYENGNKIGEMGGGD